MCEAEQKRIRELEDKLDKALREIEELKKRLRVAEGAEVREKERLFKPLRRRFRRPGGRKNHPGVSRRTPVPDETEELALGACPVEGCGQPLSGPWDIRDHSVTDLLPARPRTTRYRVPRYRCPVHGLVSPAVPGALPGARFGVGFMVWLAYHRLLGVPFGKIRKLLLDLYDLQISKAALISIHHRTVRELRPIYDRLREEIRSAEAVYADPTGWRVNGRNRSLWGFVSEAAALFAVERGKGQAAVRKHLGDDWDGTLVVDGYPGYDRLDFVKQRCHAHLLRELREVLHRRSGATLHFRRFAKKVKRLFRDSERCAERVKDPGERARWKAHYEERLDGVVAKRITDPDAVRISKTLRRYRNEWFTFLAEDVEFTTNRVERPLRGPVTVRKISHGSRSEEGAGAVAVVWSVAETCRMRGLSFLEVVQRTLAATAGPSRT
jgi:hypothetical protein